MRYFGTSILLAILSLGFSGATQAAISTDINTKTNQEETKKDASNELTWNDIIENTETEAKKMSELTMPIDLRDRTLAQWRAKQSHLWAMLPEGTFTINASAYTAAADECGKSDGITASGVKVTENRTIACPPTYPFGAKIAIEGYGTYICEDRGGAIKGNKFDIYMETKKEAFAFGRRNLLAEVAN